MIIFSFAGKAQTNELANCNIAWDHQSKHSGESMPCGGSDIGLNVWVENDEVLFYIAKSGSFDENNAILKQGRIRIKLYASCIVKRSRNQLPVTLLYMHKTTYRK